VTVVVVAVIAVIAPSSQTMKYGPQNGTVVTEIQLTRYNLVIL